MGTARDLIISAMKDAGVVGVGQTPLAEDTNDALSRLNAMMAQWARRRWTVYHLIDVVFPATGALSYTLGPGGNLNVPRTNKIESAFFRLLTGGSPENLVDYPLAVLNSREDYNQISLKSLASFPSILFYDSGWPLGNVYIWPVPSSQYEIHLSIKAELQTFGGLSVAVDLPPEYDEALRLNLAVRLRVAYRLPADPQLNGLAKIALNTVKNANTQIPALNYPSDLPRGSSGRYNIFSDGNR